VTITIDMSEMIEALTVVSDGNEQIHDALLIVSESNEQIYNSLLMLNGLLSFVGALLVVILFAIVWSRW